MLLLYNINGNLEDDTCNARFYLACVRNNIEIVKLLINNLNININCVNKYGLTAFHYACIHNSIEIIKLLLNNSQLNLNIYDKNGYTAFHYACSNGNIEIIKLLINEPRLNINIYNKNGKKTALHLVRKSNLDSIPLFLSSNRQFNLDGINFLNFIENKNNAFIENLNKIKKDKISKNQKLIFAAADNDVNYLKFLLKKKKFYK